ncbi:hypothetical protein Acr_22g0006550 [Actinidia rufa]|uniref:Uncharacterized protein n=1 Tax=Actinidia rufa TaxID=165716 RepID=A0A7J0GKB4_9ERIC|nr:hypothetical protein Acr_22g0006550 [Actinidia rufa]
MGLTVIDSNTQSSHYHIHKVFPLLQLHPLRRRLQLHLPHSLSPPPPLPLRLLFHPPPRPHHRRRSLRLRCLLLLLLLRPLGNFLGNLKSYVREEDGSVILKLAGGLCVLIFCLEWVVLTLAFFLKYYASVDGGDNSMKRSAKVQQMEDEDMKNWPWPFQV